MWTAEAHVSDGVGRLLPVGGRRRSDEGTLALDARFLLLSDVADVLNISVAQAYALVRSGDLPAIKVGGRGQWRVERKQLEAYIERAYADTRRFVDAHRLGNDGSHAAQ